MSFILNIERVVASWTRYIALAGLVGLLIVSMSTTLDVLLRWLANAPIKGLSDINSLAVAIVLATCFPIVLAQRQNLTIRFLGESLGTRAAGWLDAFGSVAVLGFIALLSWEVIVYAGELQASGRTTWQLRIPVAPYWWVAAAVISSCVPVQLVVLTADVVRAVKGLPPPDSGDSLGDSQI